MRPQGKRYCVNVPLQDGMDDDAYRFVYEPIMAEVGRMDAVHCLQAPACLQAGPAHALPTHARLA